MRPLSPSEGALAAVVSGAVVVVCACLLEPHPASAAEAARRSAAPVTARARNLEERPATVIHGHYAQWKREPGVLGASAGRRNRS